MISAGVYVLLAVIVVSLGTVALICWGVDSVLPKRRTR